METITFYKDNKVDGRFEKNVDEIIREFYQTEESKWDMPFDRLILNHMSLNYGSFEMTNIDWDNLYNSKRNYNKLL